MATLKLKPTSDRSTASKTRRPPLRGAGVRARPTLAQVQADREAHKPDGPTPSGRAGSRPAPDTRRPPPRPKPADARPARPADPRPSPSRPAPLPDAQTRAASEGVRLSKRMTELKLASRREADEWIEAGWVRVNGRMAVLGQRVRPDDRIEIDPAARAQQARKLTVLVNKPIGYVSGQAEDGYQPAAVLVTEANRWREDTSGRRVVGGPPPGLAPAGRLDIDSTGLLVLTQDGRIARHLIGDDSSVEKEYLVRVERTPHWRDDALALLSHGLELDGVKLKPARVSWQNEDQLRVVLREGRKRQIRRMCELVGLNVVALKRVRIGSVVLGKLPLGQWRLLRDDERF